MDAPIPRFLPLLLLLTWWLPPTPARAADPCQALPAPAAQSSEPAIRIATAACEEHRIWYRPFIDADGRIGTMKVREAERTRLANGQPAWQRVIEYWHGSGLLWQAGAGDCVAYGAPPAPSCRAFVVDTPWSAAFLSWVMRKAALPGFDGAASHLHYVRRAYREPFQSPYRVANPQAAQVRTGDLLCSVRGTARTYGFGELAALLSSNEPGLAMHCDVVVGIATAGDGTRSAHLVGGNVFDGVTMRRLRLTPGDRFDQLPMRLASDPECTPESAYACDLNRQDWSVLLQLRPSEELASLRPALPMPVATSQPVSAGQGGMPVAVPAPALRDAPSAVAHPDPAERLAVPACCDDCTVDAQLPRCPEAAGGALEADAP